MEALSAHSPARLITENNTCIDLTFGDSLSISLKQKTGIDIANTGPEKIPLNADNAIYRITKHYLQTRGIQKGVKISIEKNIPPSRGLFGKDSNVVTTLSLLQTLFQDTDQYDIPEDMLSSGYKQYTPISSSDHWSIVCPKYITRLHSANKNESHTYLHEHYPDLQRFMNLLRDYGAEEAFFCSYGSAIYAKNIPEQYHEKIQHKLGLRAKLYSAKSI